MNINDQSENTNDSPASASLSIVSSPDTTTNDTVDHKSPDDKDNAKALQNKLDNMISQSFMRMAKISKEAAQLNLVRASRLVFVHVFNTYATWG